MNWTIVGQIIIGIMLPILAGIVWALIEKYGDN